jgi:hypothetical protein
VLIAGGTNSSHALLARASHEKPQSIPKIVGTYVGKVIRTYFSLSCCGLSFFTRTAYALTASQQRLLRSCSLRTRTTKRCGIASASNGLMTLSTEALFFHLLTIKLGFSTNIIGIDISTLLVLLLGFPSRSCEPMYVFGQAGTSDPQKTPQH